MSKLSDIKQVFQEIVQQGERTLCYQAVDYKIVEDALECFEQLEQRLSALENIVTSLPDSGGLAIFKRGDNWYEIERISENRHESDGANNYSYYMNVEDMAQAKSLEEAIKKAAAQPGKGG